MRQQLNGLVALQRSIVIYGEHMLGNQFLFLSKDNRSRENFLTLLKINRFRVRNTKSEIATVGLWETQSNGNEVWNQSYAHLYRLHWLLFCFQRLLEKPRKSLNLNPERTVSSNILMSSLVNSSGCLRIQDSILSNSALQITEYRKPLWTFAETTGRAKLTVPISFCTIL